MLADISLEEYYKDLYIFSQDYNYSLSDIENLPAYEIDFYVILMGQREELKRLAKLNN